MIVWTTADWRTTIGDSGCWIPGARRAGSTNEARGGGGGGGEVLYVQNRQLQWWWRLVNKCPSHYSSIFLHSSVTLFHRSTALLSLSVFLSPTQPFPQTPSEKMPNIEYFQLLNVGTRSLRYRKLIMFWFWTKMRFWAITLIFLFLFSVVITNRNIIGEIVWHKNIFYLHWTEKGTTDLKNVSGLLQFESRLKVQNVQILP